MHLMHTYQRLPVMFKRGKGDRLWDIQQTEYIDAISGIGVTSLGHAHPMIAEQIAIQATQLIHTSNMVEIYWQSLLSEKLCALSGLEKAFICNSGCEANEVALKIARLYGLKKGISHPLVIVMENAFHGRTYATNAASFNAARQTGFEYEPQITGFIRVPFNDLAAIQQVAAEHTGVVAILVEPVQGEGGVQVFAPGYLRGLRALCDQHEWLLMLDEIQSGLGRTGQWFAYQHEQIVPDVLTLAKALGNGVPIGACLATAEAARVFSPGGYGTTFGGNPLASRVACTVLDIMQAEQVVCRVGETGTAVLARLKHATAANPQVLNVRGLGMMLGIELARPAHHLMTQALQQEQLLINVTRERVIRLLPCLISTEHTLNLVIAKVADLLAQLEHPQYQQLTMA